MLGRTYLKSLFIFFCFSHKFKPYYAVIFLLDYFMEYFPLLIKD